MVSVSSFSEAGGHAANEDVFVVRRHPAGTESWLCFLADGQGGSAGGAEAARIACHTAVESALHRSLRELTRPAAWKLILKQVDRAVLADPAAGLTTLLGFCISDGFLAGASSGDSAVFAVSGRRPGRGPDGGPAEEPTGPDPAGRRSSRSRPDWSGSWAVLAMSDGVWKYVGWERLVQAAVGFRGEACVSQLQRAARLPGSGRFPDDFTAVVFEDVVWPVHCIGPSPARPGRAGGPEGDGRDGTGPPGIERRGGPDADLRAPNPLSAVRAGSPAA